MHDLIGKLPAWENFTDGIKSQETRFDYTRKLKFLLEFAFDVEIPRKAQWDEESGKEQLAIIKSYAEKFVRRAKQNKGFAEGRILDFIRRERERAESREISGSHLRNMLKPIRLLLNMNSSESRFLAFLSTPFLFSNPQIIERWLSRHTLQRNRQLAHDVRILRYRQRLLEPSVLGFAD